MINESRKDKCYLEYLRVELVVKVSWESKTSPITSEISPILKNSHFTWGNDKYTKILALKLDGIL